MVHLEELCCRGSAGRLEVLRNYSDSVQKGAVLLDPLQMSLQMSSTLGPEILFFLFGFFLRCSNHVTTKANAF